MAASRGETPGFLADLTNRHPFNDNAELLWHCRPFPHSLAKKDSKPSVIRCQSQFAIKGGDITLVRFGSLINGEYRLFADEAVGVEGPPTKGNYVWVETENWPRWERKFIIVAQLSGGGRVANALSVLGRLGAQAQMFGIVGDDLYGQFCKRDLEDQGVDVSKVIVHSGANSNFCVVLAEKSTGGRSIIRQFGTCRRMLSARLGFYIWRIWVRSVSRPQS